MTCLSTSPRSLCWCSSPAGVLSVFVTYFRRRRAGVRPWRPPNSRILGYDAPIPEIVRPAEPSHIVDEPVRPAEEEP